MVGGGHVDSSDLNNIARRTLFRDWASCKNLNLSWNMSDWNLIRRFLNLYLLVAHKFALLNLKNELTFDLIFDAPLTWTFNSWSESTSTYHLINLKTTSITSIDSYLNARLNVTAPCNNTFKLDHSTNAA